MKFSLKPLLGQKKREYRDMLHRYGLKNAKVWHLTYGNTQYLLTMHDITAEAQDMRVIFLQTAAQPKSSAF